MVCDLIRTALSGFRECEETSNGARIMTHCLYPSFEAVHVYVAKVGDGFRVHDSGGAFQSAWTHGRDATLITRFLNREASRFHLAVTEDALIADVPSPDWLSAGILAVSNASANAATSAVSHFAAAAEDELVDRMYRVLQTSFTGAAVMKEVASRGRSGKEYHFDFGVRGGAETLILINAVSPHPASISAKYVSFSDGGPEATAKLAVHDRKLEDGDVALLQQVAEIVPFKSLAAGTQRAMAHG